MLEFDQKNRDARKALELPDYVTFEVAKNDTSPDKVKQRAYLERLLIDEFKIVKHERRNPSGPAGAWFEYDVQKSKDELFDRIAKVEAPFEGRQLENYRREFDDVRQLGIYVKCRDPPGQKQNYPLVVTYADIFTNFTESEFKNMLRYAKALAASWNDGMVFGLSMPITNKRLAIYRGTILKLEAAYESLSRILDKTDIVADDKTREIQDYYLTLYRNMHRALSNLAETAVIEEDIQAHQFVKQIVDVVDDKMHSLGYKHERAGEKYELVPIK